MEKKEKKTNKQRPIFAIVYGLILVACTVYIVLDIFVIKEVYVADTTQMNTSMFENLTPTPEPTSTPTPILTTTPSVTPTPSASPSPTPIPIFTEEEIVRDDYFSNDHLHVEISEYREYDTDIHVAEVYVTSAQYIKTAFARDKFGKNLVEKTSSMAKRNKAVFAVNGDFYGSREGGYVIRNGVLYRSYGFVGLDVLGIMPDGSFYQTNYKKNSAKSLVEMGVWQGFTFGPHLIVDGNINVKKNQEVMWSFATNPRTAVGIVEPLHYFFVVSDGRTKKSPGLSLYQLAEFMQKLGCSAAFNLDGGGSSTMYFNGKVINFPTSYGTYREREVSDIVYLQ